MPNTPAVWLDQIAVSTSGLGGQDRTRVVQLSNGNILVAWTNADNTPLTAGANPGTDIIGRIFNAGGIPVTDEFALNSFAYALDEKDPDIAALPGGGFVVAYSRVESGVSKIFLERYDNAGTLKFGDAVPTTSAGTVSHGDPHVSVNSSGVVMLAYTSGPAATSTVDAMIYNASTNAFSSQISVFTNAVGSVGDLDIAAAPSSLGFVIVGVNKDGGNENGLVYRALSPTGANVINATFIPGTYGTATAESSPVITSYAPGNGVAIAYASGNFTTQTFTKNMVTLDVGTGIVSSVRSTSSSSLTGSPDIATLADGSIVVAYPKIFSAQGNEVTRFGTGFTTTLQYGPGGAVSTSLAALVDGRFASVCYDSTSGPGIVPTIRLNILDTRDTMGSATYGDGGYLYQAGTVGNDVFTADGNDYLTFGGPGNDIITETFNVRTYGGDGNDRLIVTDAVGGEFHDGGAGIDTLDFGSSNTGGIILNLAAGTVQAVGAISIDSAVNFENAVGTSGIDFITGTIGDNVIEGKNGPDTLTGGGGNDTFTGALSQMFFDTITDFSPGDRIVSLVLDQLTNVTLTGTQLTFRTLGNTVLGSITLANAPYGKFSTTAVESNNGTIVKLQSTTLADANGDGRADIFWRNVDGRIADWTGTANGLFTGNTASIASITPDWKVVGKGDFNGDGFTDILIRNDNGTTANWLGNAAGIFAPNNASLISISNDWKIAGTGDFNGDGRLDIVWRNDDGRYVNWLANASGVFSGNGASSGTISTVWKIAGTGDFNGDGRSDILWRNDDGTLADWLSNASGVFVPNNASVLAALASFTVAGTGDLNRDGRSDVVLRSAAGQVLNYIALGDGRLVRDMGANLNIGTAAIADVGDYNYDGLTDLLVRAPDGTVGARLALAPEFTANALATAAVPNDWKIFGNRDYNGDGRADILWRNDNGQFGTWLGQANGSYAVNAAPLVSVSTDWSIATTGDFNGDGRADILWRNTNGTIGRWSANADASFTADNGSVQLVTNDWKIFGSGDFNGDGRADILWRNDNGTIADWLGTTSGAFTPNNSSLASVTLDWKIAGTGDFNGDGRSDILWRNDNGTVGSWFGNPDGSFTGNPNAVLVGTGWNVAGTGDYDGDGRTDVLMRDTLTGNLRTWLATTDNSFVQSNFLNLSLNPSSKIVGSGDANGNGLADILVRASDGTLTDYLTRGTGFSTTSPQTYGVPTDWQVVR